MLNTRPLPQGEHLNQAINTAGGIAIACPALTIVPTDETWLSALPDLQQVTQAIFISANAVDYCFIPLAQRAWPTTIQVIAIGRATAEALTNHGIQVNLIPAHADSEHLLKLKELQEVNSKMILLFKGEGGRPLIAETLLARGAKLFIFDVYKRLMPKPNSGQLYSLWHNKAVDIILFTSQQAMHNIFALFGEDAHAWLCSVPCLVISERLAKEAALLGMQTIIISTPETILTTLYQFNQGLIDGRKQ